MSSVLITLIISLRAVAAAEAPPGAGHVTTVNHAAPKAQPAPGKTPLALLASVGGAPQAGKRAPLARARAQHATAIKHAQLVHLHNRTRAELARQDEVAEEDPNVIAEYADRAWRDALAGSPDKRGTFFNTAGARELFSGPGAPEAFRNTFQ